MIEHPHQAQGEPGIVIEQGVRDFPVTRPQTQTLSSWAQLSSRELEQGGGPMRKPNRNRPLEKMS